MTLHACRGDLFDADVEALVNTVNTVGVITLRCRAAAPRRAPRLERAADHR
jgi:hypothetical protein